MRPLSYSSTVAITIAIAMIALIAVYFKRYRQQSPDVYVSQAAWLRAGIYFCACYQVGIFTGVFNDLLQNPIATKGQLENTVWWIWVAGLFLLVTAAYWGIWALLGASLAMRMPAPWSQEVARLATLSSGLFGLPRASGYVSPDPENDTYLKAAHLPR